MTADRSFRWRWIVLVVVVVVATIVTVLTVVIHYLDVQSLYPAARALTELRIESQSGKGGLAA